MDSIEKNSETLAQIRMAALELAHGCEQGEQAAAAYKTAAAAAGAAATSGDQEAAADAAAAAHEAAQAVFGAVEAGHLVEALREMHKAAANMLIVEGGGAHPLVYLDDLHARTLEALGAVAFQQGLDYTISYILTGFVDGVRRPGSWERGCVEQFFGGEATSAAALIHRATAKKHN